MCFMRGEVTGPVQRQTFRRKTMTISTKHSLFALSAVLLAGAAFAQTPPVSPASAAPAPGMHARHEGMRGGARDGAAMTAEQRQARIALFQARMAERQAKMAARQADLHAKLRLTPAQEPAWNTFVAAIKPAPRTFNPGEMANRRAEMARMTLPQRLERRMQRMQERQAHMATRVAALRTFYAALSPEQRRVLDENMQHRRGMDGEGRGMGRHHGMHRMG
jgi:protein CpxP